MSVDLTASVRLRDEMSAGVNRITDSFRRLSRASGDVQSSSRRCFSEMAEDSRAAGRSVDTLASKIKGIGAAAAAMAGLGAIKKLAQLSDEMASTDARLNLIVDDGGSVDALKSKIMASAFESRASYQATADAVAKLGMNASEAFSTNDELIAFAEQVNKLFTISGTDGAQASAAMLQLTQAMGSGVLRGDELNSIFEAAPVLIRKIADHMGVSVSQIRKMASEGQITADVIKSALLGSAEETNKMFQGMSMTWGQLGTMTMNGLYKASEPLLKLLNLLANKTYEHREEIKEFGNVSLSVMGGVAGGAAILGAFVLNSSIIPVHNGLASLANFFGNVFKHPAASVKILFLDMCQNVLGYVSKLISGIQSLINLIPGVEVNLTGGINGIISGISSKKSGIIKESGYKEYVKQRDYLDYNSTGVSVYNGVKNLFSSPSGSTGTTVDWGSYNNTDAVLNEIANGVSDTAKNTGKINNTLELSADDLKLLREMAEEKAINNYSSATVKIEMTNNNTVASDADLDGIISALSDRVEEAVAVAAEGGHV